MEQTVAAIEQILDVMPDDLLTLRTLFETLIQLERPEDALECLGRLDEACRTAQDASMMEYVCEQYASVADAMPDAKKRMERLQELLRAADVITQQSALASEDSAGKTALESEMALAWDLLQDELLSEEEYSHVLQDLTEMSGQKVDVPVTVLHVLHDRNFSRFERLMAHMSLKSGVPIVPLERFDEVEGLREVLPLEFMSRNGALPFGEVAGDLLIAVLNPFDKALLRRTEKMCGRRCHAYLVEPVEYDARLGAIRKAKQSD